MNADQGMFVDPPRDDEKLYNSRTDLLVVSASGDLDDSYRKMREARYNVATDLQMMADRVLGMD